MNNAKHRLNTMSVHQLCKAALAVTSLAALGMTSTALAQTTLDWTGSTSATGPANASGDWDQSTNNWWNGTANVAWTNGDTARFDTTTGTGTYTVTLTENITAAALFMRNGTMTYQFNGTNRSLTLGSLSTVNNKSTVFNVPVILSGNQTWNLQGSAPVTANQPISGAFTLSKSGNGTLTLNAANSFSALFFSAGKIAIGNDDALGTATVDITGSPTWESTAARTFNNSISTGVGQNPNIGFSGTHAMTFAGNYSFSTGTGGDRNLTYSVGTTDGVTLSGNILKADTSNTRLLNIIKTGSSTLTLSGTNAYNGTTTVSAGTLLINGDQTASPGLTTVAADAILGGTGTIGGAATINGIIAPGSGGIGTLAISSNATWNAGNAWLFQLGTSAASLAAASAGTDNDLLTIGGAFTQGTGSSFEFDFLGSGVDGWYKLVDYVSTDFAAGPNSSFAATNLPSGKTANFVVDATSTALYVQIVPEPAVLGLAACGVALLGLAALQRRRG